MGDRKSVSCSIESELLSKIDRSQEDKLCKKVDESLDHIDGGF